MKNTDDHKLDNPVWFSLSESHIHFAIDYTNIKFYRPEYCPFGGFDQVENISCSIRNYSSLVDSFFIVGNKPEVPNGLRIKNELVCLQMIINNRIELETKESIIELATPHGRALHQLVNLVQPGYFKEKTGSLGEYFGIFSNEKLIAVTGERMKMNSFTEVSAVVTHADHEGKGYAKQLVAHTVNNIFYQGKSPYLHVAETNIGAISLYEKLGFTTRRKISFWNITT
jgi:GNAT superfamily N-acetyltransferase